MARKYYVWFVTEHPFEASLHERPSVDAVFIRVQCARRLLAGGDHARAFLMLHLACENLRTLFEGYPFQLLLEFFRTFVKPGWAAFSDVRDAMLRQMMQMSQIILGAGHPLSKLTELFMDAVTMAEAGPKFLSLLSDIINEHLGQPDQALRVQLILAECFIALDELDMAEMMCSQCLSDADFGKPSFFSHQNVQKARKNLGCIRYKLGSRDEAQRIWLEVYNKDISFCNGFIFGSDAVINCTHLASLYEGQGDYGRSSMFYKVAFEGALRTWGPVIVDLYEYFSSLHDTLLRFGNFDEVEKLLSDHGLVMRDWDRKQVEAVVRTQWLAPSLLICGNPSGRKKCDFDAGLHRHFVTC